MIIFNQGKYKSLYAAQPDELAQLADSVAQDKDFRPRYHLAPPTGLLNDPNGLLFDGEKYHVFYQWFPFDALHGMKHWKHLITADFQHFRPADNLIPCEMFESHGCYSGGALLVGEQIAVFYTGNTRRAADNQRVPYQNLALFDKAGNLLRKRALIEQAPPGYTEHVRDPKPFFSAEGKIRFICGAQRTDLSGTAIVFEMDDLDATPRLLGELSVPAFDNRQVFMWECPDLFHHQAENKDIFIWSPQGKARQSTQFQNNYHAVYALGKLDGLRFDAERIAELDQGFDFYAPQTFSGVESLMLGWVGLPDLSYPTERYKWHSMLTLPRALRLVGDRIYQSPATEIYRNLTALSDFTIDKQAEIARLDCAYVKFNAQQQPFSLRFFDNPQGQHLTLSYDGNRLCLDRTFSEQTDSMRQLGSQRYCEIDQLEQVEIFFDRSVIEIFLNDGEKAMTSRFFIADRAQMMTTDRPLALTVGYPQAICEK
ncbi:glycoside hydrolase family 32 protein [Necropsobacter rosorum]|uniref:glycoside hydrolase family 32 protein n=1 Tax=Necropsobacter rosorum TaxID=908285 RepID=UPI000509734E